MISTAVLSHRRILLFEMPYQSWYLLKAIVQNGITPRYRTTKNYFHLNSLHTRDKKSLSETQCILVVLCVTQTYQCTTSDLQNFDLNFIMLELYRPEFFVALIILLVVCTRVGSDSYLLIILQIFIIHK
jgi:hypothetical protein